MHVEYLPVRWCGLHGRLKICSLSRRGFESHHGYQIMTIEDEVLRKRQEIQRYKEMLARYESGRWLNYGKARLAEKIQELKILEESLAPIV